MIKTLLIILLILVLLHFLCGSIYIFLYLNKSIRMDFNIGDFILMMIFGPALILVFGVLYLLSITETVFEKLKKKVYERKTKV